MILARSIVAHPEFVVRHYDDINALKHKKLGMVYLLHHINDSHILLNLIQFAKFKNVRSYLKTRNHDMNIVGPHSETFLSYMLYYKTGSMRNFVIRYALATNQVINLPYDYNYGYARYDKIQKTTLYHLCALENCY